MHRAFALKMGASGQVGAVSWRRSRQFLGDQMWREREDPKALPLGREWVVVPFSEVGRLGM